MHSCKAKPHHAEASSGWGFGFNDRIPLEVFNRVLSCKSTVSLVFLFFFNFCEGSEWPHSKKEDFVSVDYKQKFAITQNKIFQIIKLHKLL